MSKAKLRIKNGDTVIVISGKEKGKIGKVVRVDPEGRKVAVEGVRVAKRHNKPANGNAGGITYKEAFIDVSNVAFWDAATQKRVKVGYQVVDGQKVRVDRKSGAALDKE